MINMKKFLFTLTLALSVLALGSCTKESAGRHSVVDYVKITLLGDKEIYIDLGGQYEEPGYTATDKGVDALDKVEVTITNLDGEEVEEITTDQPGMFTITYAAESQDKVAIQTYRTVYVYDPALAVSLSGTFAVDFEQSTCASAPAAAGTKVFKPLVAYYNENGSYAGFAVDNFDLVFKEVCPGIYTVNDLLGGWYHAVQGRGGKYEALYGAQYATYFDMKGMVFLNADGTIALASSQIDAWGDGLDYLKDALLEQAGEEPATGDKLYFEVSYADGAVGPIKVYATRK